MGTRFTGVGGAIVAAAVAAAIAVAGCGGTAARHASTSMRPEVVPSQLLGLSAGPPPWGPEYSDLVQRLATLRLPPPSDVVYHVHAILHVYVNGRRQIVPPDVGIDVQHNLLASLHTHDATGVIHMEATAPFPFRLADFFDVWGVLLTPTQLGPYRNAGDRTVHFYVNGRPLTGADPTSYVMHAHDDLVVAYGRDGSFPTRPSTAALAGL
jgi:hypothetical protein